MIRFIGGLVLFLVPLSAACNADSLTISPIGLSFHGKSNSELAPYAPRKLDKKADWTWHPEINLIYKQKYMQYSLFYMKDTVNQHAGGFQIGPKFDFLKFFSLGISLGLLIRSDRYYGSINWSVNNVQFIPMGGLTASIKVPIYHRYSFETNLLANGFINHAVAGIRIDW